MCSIFLITKLILAQLGLAWVLCRPRVVVSIFSGLRAMILVHILVGSAVDRFVFLA